MGVSGHSKLSVPWGQPPLGPATRVLVYLRWEAKRGVSLQPGAHAVGWGWSLEVEKGRDAWPLPLGSWQLSDLSCGASPGWGALQSHASSWGHLRGWRPHMGQEDTRARRLWEAPGSPWMRQAMRPESWAPEEGLPITMPKRAPGPKDSRPHFPAALFYLILSQGRKGRVVCCLGSGIHGILSTLC